ncbi:MAG: sialic acid-specific 9-O-acetylesterase [Ferruginibacter sp.]|nr:sialic acid-specific 9-O-acetylesterase [Ferruginibacter sp.]
MPQRVSYKPLLSFITGLVLSYSSIAAIRLPAIISDNMVLQQKSAIVLWGWADAGEKIIITAGWNKHPATVVANELGSWSVKLKTTGAGGPYTISFSASNTIVINNVLLGEVWLASGQSNMEFFMAKTSNSSYTGVINYQQEIKEADFPLIRMIDVPNKVADEPQNDFSGRWKICSPQTADTFSAVAYYFAKEIHKATGYPIGIINASWGGTPAESWTKKSILENDKDFNEILERYNKQCEAYPVENEKYKQAFSKWKADTAKRKGGAPTAPIGPNHNKSPYKLYNGMIAPIIPYTLKGVIWYQGEGNADRAFQYRRLFPAMIDSWRTDFNNRELPFYFVQISPHRSQNAEIRDAQLWTYRTVAHSGMAVTTDNGDSLNIHPRNKKLVGERLSLWALKNEYGKK